MFPYCLGTTKIRSTAVTKASYTAADSVTFLCIRCSRTTIKSNNTSNPAVICTKGHIQCRECDTVMRHQCRRCGILTTEGLKHDMRMKNIDPRTMSPEELTQLELNAALNQFKSNFLKKKKQSRLYESTCRIIEILNPNLILLYKQCGRIKRKKIEEHFFRTSEKFEHSFEWHKAALEFVMERLINFDFYGTFYEMELEMRPNVELLRRSKKNMIALENHLDSFEKPNIITHNREGCNKRSKKHKYQLECCNKQQMSTHEHKNHTAAADMMVSEDMPPVIFVKPTKWLTEILCPHCGLNLRLSDFSKHFAIYHCLPIECMDVAETKQIFLDPKVLLNRTSYPHTLFLVNNCVRNLGGSDFRNFYPIVLITATICMTDFYVNVNTPKCEHERERVCKNERKREREQEQERKRKYLMLWLSGISLNDQIQICLKVISMHFKDSQQCLILNKLYPITRPQHLKNIHESKSMIMLSPETLRSITKNGNESIILEITVHIKNTSSM